MGDDDTTRIIRKSKKTEEDADKTVMMGSEEDTEFSRRDSASDGDETKLYRPQKSKDDNELDNKNYINNDDDLVVGWIVIMDGPGKGKSHDLGYGLNGIGRADSERISLNYGDEEISREGHSSITYDYKNERFFLQHGGGANITYLGDEPVLQPVEIFGYEIISIGKTKVCFVPFCGKNFSW